MKRKILLIDVSSLVYRAFFALPFMASKDGMPTNALYGFINMYNAAVRQIAPDVVIACFDSKEETIRKKEYADYKSQRRQMPDEFFIQLPFVEEFLNLSGALCARAPGYEADDIIASFCRESDTNTYYVLSSDKDMMQLVSDESGVFLCSYKSGKINLIGEKDVQEKFGVYPGQIVDFLALVGDSSDNIQGVKGIGKKTAQNLLKNYKTIDGIFSHIEEITPKRIRDSLLSSKELIERNIGLIKLNTDVPVPEIPNSLKYDITGLKAFFQRFGFKSLISRLDKDRQENKDIVSYVPLRDSSRLAGRAVAISKRDNGHWALFVKGSKELYEAPAGVVKELLSNLDVEKLICDQGDWIGEFNPHSIAGSVIPLGVALNLANIGETGNSDYLLQSAFDLYDKALNQMDRRMIEFFKEVDVPLFLCLLKMRNSGVEIDKKQMESLFDDLEEEQSNIIKRIFSVVGYEFNLNSPKQLANVLFNDRNLPIIKKGRSHPSTSEDVLKKLALLDELPKLILDYRHVNKLISAYIKPLLSSIEKDGRIHCKFSQISTQTGRLTAVEPNLQTIPIRSEWGKKLRKAFISRFSNGYILSADYSQIELRVLAHMSRDKALMDAFRNALDVHKQTAALILNREIDEITPEDRDLAKRVNFGIIYGMSAYGLSEQAAIPVDVAREFIDLYFEKFSGVKEFIDKTVANAQINGYVETMFGRRRYLPELSAKAHSVIEFGKRAAVNTVIQGSAAEIIKKAMVAIDRGLLDRAVLALQIHDELLLDVEENILDRTARFVKKEMEQAVELSVPLVVNVKAGKNWLELEQVL